jgi:hypothetical protein
VDWDLQSRQSLFSSSTLHRHTLGEEYNRLGLDMRRIREQSTREEERKEQRLIVRTHDCVAESPDQLMYISGDTLILLREEEEVVIAACEGVVGWIKKGDVDFNLSPPLTKENGGIPNTIIQSPTPPTHPIPLPADDVYAGVDDDEGGLEVDAPTPDSRRASGPFDLGTPNHSPGVERENTEFFDQVPPLPSTTATEVEVGRDEETQRRIRESYRSSASSGLGGIGGFMMGNNGDDSLRLDTSGLKGTYLDSIYRMRKRY